jgi:hypothetical protein
MKTVVRRYKLERNEYSKKESLETTSPQKKRSGWKELGSVDFKSADAVRKSK